MWTEFVFMCDVVSDCHFGAVSVGAEGAAMKKESFAERIVGSKVAAIWNGGGVAMTATDGATTLISCDCVWGAWIRSMVVS